jgi:low affinity Fe/Cu permease
LKLIKHFSNFSRYVARLTGRPAVFILACSVVIVWFVTGPLFSFSDTWQLIINTGTTIITFIMVFLIQNTQNRDSEAVQIKLDELIRSHKGAHNALLDLEELTEDQLDRIKARYETLASRARVELSQGKSDTKITEV